MAFLNMNGPFPFTEEEVDKQIENNRIGNYAYGYQDFEGVFRVKYVGRSDDNLKKRIKHGLTEYEKKTQLRYKMFKFSYARTAIEAYEKECRNYHDFGGEEGMLVNDIHPDSPAGMNLACPICDIA